MSGQNHNIKTCNTLCENAAKTKQLTPAANQNNIEEKIQIRLELGYTRY